MPIIYYRKIEIDQLEEIKIKCLEYVKTQKEIYFQHPFGAFRFLNFQELTAHCPALLTAFIKYSIQPTYAAAFVTYRNSSVPVHVDAGSDLARINIPLQNCKNTYTEFYTGGVIQSYYNPITGIVATTLVGPDLTLVDKVEIDQATVIRVKEPHSVRMDENYAPRVTLTIGFDRDPVFLLES